MPGLQDVTTTEENRLWTEVKTRNMSVYMNFAYIHIDYCRGT